MCFYLDFNKAPLEKSVKIPGGAQGASNAARGVCVSDGHPQEDRCTARGVPPGEAQGAGTQVPGDVRPRARGLSLRGDSLKGLLKEDKEVTPLSPVN